MTTKSSLSNHIKVLVYANHQNVFFLLWLIAPWLDFRTRSYFYGKGAFQLNESCNHIIFTFRQLDIVFWHKQRINFHNACSENPLWSIIVNKMWFICGEWPSIFRKTTKFSHNSVVWPQNHHLVIKYRSWPTLTTKNVFFLLWLRVPWLDITKGLTFMG